MGRLDSLTSSCVFLSTQKPSLGSGDLDFKVKDPFVTVGETFDFSLRRLRAGVEVEVGFCKRGR